MLDLNEAVDKLDLANRIHWYNHSLRALHIEDIEVKERIGC